MKDSSLVVVLSLVVIAGGAGLVWYGLQGSAPPIVGEGQGEAGVAVAFTPIAHGIHGGVLERTNYLITSAEDFAELWKMLGDATGSPPTVDFSRNNVAAVFAGQRPNPGHTVSVLKVLDTGVKRLVTIILASPGKGCIEAQVLTSPYEIVTTPKTALPFEHEDIEGIKDCE